MINNIVANPPVCECSDCILHPEDSHGIHVIGTYRAPVVMHRRSGRALPEGVSYTFPNMGIVAPLFNR